jgi:hypothetical protein
MGLIAIFTGNIGTNHQHQGTCLGLERIALRLRAIFPFADALAPGIESQERLLDALLYRHFASHPYTSPLTHAYGRVLRAHVGLQMAFLRVTYPPVCFVLGHPGGQHLGNRHAPTVYPKPANPVLIKGSR